MPALLAPGQKVKAGAKSGSRDKTKTKSKVYVRKKVQPVPANPISTTTTTTSVVSKVASPGMSNEKNGKKVGGARSKSRERTRGMKSRIERTETETDEKPQRSAPTPKKSQPQKVTIAHHTVDQNEMRELLKKMKAKKTAPRTEPRQLSQRDKLLMDVVKKPPHRQYKYRAKNPLPLAEEDASFFDKPEPKTVTVTTTEEVTTTTTPSQEDSYGHVPKLADVEKMPNQNVYEPDGVTPYWATVLEPNEEQLKDVADPISVGSDHVEMMNEGKIQLKTSKGKNLVLDEFQPMKQLVKRDVAHFHDHLVFSNTIRTLINVNVKIVEKAVSDNDEQMTQREESVSWDDQKPIKYIYSRSDPIGSSRDKVQPGMAGAVSMYMAPGATGGGSTGGSNVGGSADSDSIEGK